jgi:hypothetical protein
MGSMGQAPGSRSKQPGRFRFVGALALLLVLVMGTQGALRAASGPSIGSTRWWPMGCSISRMKVGS